VCQTSNLQVNGHDALQARKEPQTAVLDKFTILENSYTDDDLVCAVSPELKPPESSTRFTPQTRVSLLNGPRQCVQHRSQVITLHRVTLP
jgi:hypothetical protein